jgi:hypothetical protein
MSDKLNDTQRINEQLKQYYKTIAYDVEVSAKIVMGGNDYVNMFRIEELNFDNIPNYTKQFESLLKTILNTKFLNEGGDL